MVTSASVPDASFVVIVTAPVNALVVVSRVIVASLALVTRVVVPVIAKAPVSVMFPVVAVAVSAPVTVDAAKLKKLAQKAGIPLEEAGQPHDCAGLNACKGLGGCHVDAAKLQKLKAKLAG